MTLFWIGVLGTLAIMLPIFEFILSRKDKIIDDHVTHLVYLEGVIIDYVEADLKTPLELSTAATDLGLIGPDSLATHLEAYEHWEFFD